MSRCVILVDTSILCNIIPVPGRDQKRAVVYGQLRCLIESGHATLLLPVATIFETGNLIAQMALGDRYHTAARFVRLVEAALDGAAPWAIARPLLDDDQLRRYVRSFPTFARQTIGLVDVTLIHEAERQQALMRRSPGAAIHIWTLDADLASHSPNAIENCPRCRGCF